MPLTVVRPGDPLPAAFSRSIYLSGPARTPDGVDWRSEAIRILDELGFDGVVYDPIVPGLTAVDVTNEVVEWQWAARNRSDMVVGWLGAESERTSGGTRSELMHDLQLGKAVLGVAPNYRRTDQLITEARRRNVPVVSGLRAMLVESVNQIGPGIWREGGECEVPLSVYRTPQFQGWLASHKTAPVSDRLRSAKLNWVHRGGNGMPFAFAIQVAIEIGDEIDPRTGENRVKSNEFVAFRTDMSHVVPVCIDESDIDNSQVVLVVEFRSAVSNAIGKAIEPPGGSPSLGMAMTDEDVAMEELAEEVGIHDFDRARLIPLGRHQVSATFSAHRDNVYVALLTKEEMAAVCARADEVLGVEADTERTTRLIPTVGNVLDGDVGCDLASMGMVGMARRALTKLTAAADREGVDVYEYVTRNAFGRSSEVQNGSLETSR